MILPSGENLHQYIYIYISMHILPQVLIAEGIQQKLNQSLLRMLQEGFFPYSYYSARAAIANPTD